MSCALQAPPPEALRTLIYSGATRAPLFIHSGEAVKPRLHHHVPCTILQQSRWRLLRIALRSERLITLVHRRHLRQRRRLQRRSLLPHELEQLARVTLEPVHLMPAHVLTLQQHLVVRDLQFADVAAARDAVVNGS